MALFGKAGGIRQGTSALQNAESELFGFRTSVGRTSGVSPFELALWEGIDIFDKSVGKSYLSQESVAATLERCLGRLNERF